MLVAMTAKEIAGYLKARSAKRRDVLGGITFNDGYNVPTFGITKATYDAINRAMTDEYGAFGEPTNLTPAVVKKALKNHLERGTRHHATKKSGTWERVASVSVDWHDDAGSVASDLADAVERKFGVERMIEGAYPNFRVLAKGDESTLEKARVYAEQWLANASEQARRHHATKKKSPAQLQREIDEVLATPVRHGERLISRKEAEVREAFDPKLYERAVAEGRVSPAVAERIEKAGRSKASHSTKRRAAPKKTRRVVHATKNSSEAMVEKMIGRRVKSGWHGLVDGEIIQWEPFGAGMTDVLVKDAESGKLTWYASHGLSPIDGKGPLPSRAGVRKIREAEMAESMKKIGERWAKEPPPPRIRR